jgi:hypothetical protein
MRVLAMFALAACGGSAGTTVVMTARDDVPAYGSAPFPTDAVRDGDHLAVIPGLDSLAGHHADLISAHLAALDGFGLRPLVEFFVDGPIDPDTVPATTRTLDDAAMVVDVDPASPEHGRVIAMDWRYDDARGVIAGSPTSGEVLREGTRYAAIVTTQIRDAHGAAIHRAPALDNVIAQPAARWQSTADAYADIGGDRVAGIAAFTTEHATAPLIAARTAMDTVAPATLAFGDPQIIFSGTTALDRLLGHATRATDGPRAGLERWGNDNPTGMAHDHVGVIGTGTMTVARFRRDDTGTDLPDDETFAPTPSLVSLDEIPVTFILPAAAPPATGYPVVIYGHGLGAGRDSLVSFAEPLTTAGYAVVGIDMFGHGSRFDPTDLHNNFANRAGFTGVDMPDGFGDTTGLTTTFDFFEGFLNVAAVRDSIRQSALDLGRLSQLLRQPGLDLHALAGPGSPAPTLDTRHVAYLGESFGTVVGTLFAAIEPNIDLYVLDVPGGGILDRILPASAEIGDLALPLIESIYAPRARVDRWSPLIGLMQAVLDGGDPLSYAPHITRDRFAISGTPLAPRSIVLLEVVGDQVLSNQGTIALAQELRLDVLAPSLAIPDGLAAISSPAAGNADGQTAVLVQYAPATHGANWSSETGVLRYLPGFPSTDPDDPFPKLPAPITIANPIYDTLDQVVEIVQTHQAGQAPVVKMTRPPVADFDGDGVPDDADPAPYDPTIH